jgi:hypothetical protein
MKPTKIVNIEGVFENNRVERRSSYWFPSPGMSHVVVYRRFFMPGLTDDSVKIEGVYLSDAEANVLRTPLTLTELNAMLQVFQWPRERCKFLVQTRSGPLYLEAEITVERPYWESEIDRAYRGWLKENPGAAPDQWGSAVLHRVTLQCAVHQGQ